MFVAITYLMYQKIISTFCFRANHEIVIRAHTHEKKNINDGTDG